MSLIVYYHCHDEKNGILQMLAINLVSEMRFSPLIIYFQAARRELERQRQMEWERQRKEQLLSEKAREYEQLGTIKSRASNLKCELESQVGQPLSYKYFIFNFVVIYESTLRYIYMYNIHCLFCFLFNFSLCTYNSSLINSL